MTAQTTSPAEDTATGTEPAVVIRGSLDAEETAALTAVLQAVAVQAERHRREAAGRDEHDRTLERRRRLGLWARPGAGSWRQAAGMS
ncbi:MAG TPA: acyl-CoA carboxylase subunit epsilon [Citricoccus sp.]